MRSLYGLRFFELSELRPSFAVGQPLNLNVKRLLLTGINFSLGSGTAFHDRLVPCNEKREFMTTECRIQMCKFISPYSY